MPPKPIARVVSEQAESLMAIPGVVGVMQGECDGHPCIRVLIAHRTPEVSRSVPGLIESYLVVINEVGPIWASPAD